MADHVVVVASGNADKIFQSALGSSKAQVVEVDALAAVGDAVKAVFR